MDKLVIADYGKFMKKLSTDSVDNVFQDVEYVYITNSKDPRLAGIGSLVSLPLPIILAQNPGSMLLTDPDVSEFMPQESLLKSNRKHTNSYDATQGSPLKMQEYADLSDIVVNEAPVGSWTSREHFKSALTKIGIPFNQTRVVASLYSLASQGNSLPPLLIFSDGQNRKHTACQMLSREEQYLKFTVIKVSFPEPKNGHFPKIHNLKIPEKQMKYKARYDMMGKMLQELVTNGQEFAGSLVVETDWTKPICTAVLQSPPLESQAHIQAQVVSGDERSTANGFYIELEMLKSFIDGLESGEILWLANESHVPVLEQLKMQIEKLKLGDAAKCEKEQNDVVDILGLDSLSFDRREDLDFTDHLWNILIQCTSYSELEEALKFVFAVLSNGEFYPMVHRKNNTVIAQMVREACGGKLRMPNLAGGSYAIQLLAEIGLEKLRQDYVHAFLSKELVVLGNIESFIGTEGPFTQRLAALEKLHHVLEMSVMLKMFLKLSMQTLNFIAIQMLKYYENNSLDQKHLFDFPVPTSQVKSMIENSAPCLWQMEFTKQVQNTSETMKVVLTEDNPFPHVGWSSVSDNMTEVGSEDFRDRVYYVLHLEERVSVL
ncbi:protein zwilch homolog [Saccostrea echinata]|uniref:protein zwilch homolog n=1 Tax=Saccostrea echinata TaxID=191078 RepID=UPI002A83C40A|nr:protein zwilch homolog [Saccostrea echinata]